MVTNIVLAKNYTSDRTRVLLHAVDAGARRTSVGE